MPIVRWDRLFDDLEAQAADLELQERDALVEDLSDADWAETSWRDLVGGRIVVEVHGAGRLEGTAGLVNQQIIQLNGDGVDHVIAADAVTVLHSSQHRAETVTKVGARLGWGYVLRRLRDAGDQIRIRLVDGTAHDGVVEVVGQDFIRLRAESGRDQIIAWRAIAVVSART